jgi:hypothetical protein
MQSSKGQEGPLSHIDLRFDHLLFAPLSEDGETPLSVLSALARQNIDAWQEAARLNQLPKEAAINSFASTIWKTNSERWSPLDASIVAARLVDLLPSHHAYRGSSISTGSANSKVMMWLVYGILLGSIAISSNQQSSENSQQPNGDQNTVVQQEAVSQPPPGTSTD